MEKEFNIVLREKLREINACMHLYRLNREKIDLLNKRLISHLRAIESGDLSVLHTDDIFYFDENNKCKIKNIKIYSEYKNRVITI